MMHHGAGIQWTVRRQVLLNPSVMGVLFMNEIEVVGKDT